MFGFFLQIVSNWETNKPWLPKSRIEEVSLHVTHFNYFLFNSRGSDSDFFLFCKLGFEGGRKSQELVRREGNTSKEV